MFKLMVLVLLSSPFVFAEREIDRRCLNGDCVVLVMEGRRVLAHRVGELSGERWIGNFAEEAVTLVGPTEAPVLYATSPMGWRAVVSAFLPAEFDYDAPELRLRIFDAKGEQRTAVDDYNILGSFHIGRIFGTEREFLLMSTTGAHSYVVRTRVWLLPRDGAPFLALEVPGALKRIQTADSGQDAGVWINREMYDGIHAETKGAKQEFWVWNDSKRTLTVNQDR